MSGGVDEQAPPRPREPAGGLVRDALDDDLRAQREDRWAWRRRIRSNPHQHRIYRCVVGAVGLLLVLLSLATGWLPGPGGIPLLLLGLAVLASEFHWAHRLMVRLTRALHVFQGWSRRRKAGFWVALVAACALLGWAYLALVGQPAWFPLEVDRVLAYLPGVDVPA
jgi:Putative transmembrane protein (PGPGW)